MSDEVFVTVSQIAFTDGGPNEFQVLHRGDKEGCVQVAEFISALSYSGPRRVDQSKCGIFWMPEQYWTSLLEEKANV